MKRLFVVLGSLVVVIGAGFLTFLALKTTDDMQSDRNDQTVAETPRLSAERVMSGLDHPWDIDFLPDDTTMLVSERAGRILKVVDGKPTVLEEPDDVKAIGEGGLMGLAVDPDFARTRFIYACLNTTAGDVRVARWVMSTDASGLSERKDIVTGIPSAGSGRHSGCQLAFGPDKYLWIATGDAADETQPQDQTKLGGKVLRVTREGRAAPDNPDTSEKRVFSYGHRNLQALTFYDAKKDGSYGLSVEHGPDRDDEVNELKPGNFGWAPGASYDESVPMTDGVRFADAIESVWSSGDGTIAPSGAAILKGSSWGRLEGWLAVSVLKDQKLLLLNLTSGSVNGERTFFDGEYGRLRAATIGPDEALYVSTDNGSDDVILKITPTDPSS